jgi:predicted Zn-dependent protease
MFKDAFDKICLLLAVSVCIAMAALLVSNRENDGSKRALGVSKVLEREMAYQAKVELLTKLYGPVEALRSAGKRQEALLRLDQLIRTYPGEAHGHILQGQLLNEMGTLDEAVSSYVEGVKLNGDYVDAKSPLSRRAEIQKIVDETVKSVGARSTANPGNRSLSETMRKANYLKSRLAGGCE